MKILFIAFLAVAITNAGAFETEIEKLELNNGQILLVVETDHSRNMPWAFYDQAIKSIPLIYPNSVIIAGERLGKTGGNNEILYSLVGYKESIDSKGITISGIATFKDRAWIFDIMVKESLLSQSIRLVLQQLNQLPYSKRMQTDHQKATPFDGG